MGDGNPFQMSFFVSLFSYVEHSIILAQSTDVSSGAVDGGCRNAGSRVYSTPSLVPKAQTRPASAHYLGLVPETPHDTLGKGMSFQ